MTDQTVTTGTAGTVELSRRLMHLAAQLVQEGHIDRGGDAETLLYEAAETLSAAPPILDPSDAVVKAAQAQIVRTYGAVIGTGQAENIAYTAIVAARIATMKTMGKMPA